MAVAHRLSLRVAVNVIAKIYYDHAPPMVIKTVAARCTETGDQANSFYGDDINIIPIRQVVGIKENFKCDVTPNCLSWQMRE